MLRGGDAVGPDIGADPRYAVLVRDVDFGERDRAVELAEDRRDIVARNQAHGGGASFRRLTFRVFVEDLERLVVDPASLVDLLDAELDRVFHLLSAGKIPRRRERTDPTKHDRLCRW